MNFFFPFSKKKQVLEETTVNAPNNTLTKSENEQWATLKGELGEYKIDIQLDQFPKNYKHISDLLIQNTKSYTGYSQIDHLMITPYGIFVIETKNYEGTIYGGKERKTWLVNGKFKMMSPLVQNYGHIQAIKNFIDKSFHEFFISIISFTKRCTYKIDEELRKIQSNELVVYDIELTEFINRKVAINKLIHKEPLLSDQYIDSIYNILIEANITDLTIRKQHVEMLKNMKNASKEKSEDTKCVVCNISVSDKVKAFCLSHGKFNGNVYCYEHQKDVK